MSSQKKREFLSHSFFSLNVTARMCVCVSVYLDNVFCVEWEYRCGCRFIFGFSHSFMAAVEFFLLDIRIKRNEVRRKDDDNNQKPNVLIYVQH